MDAHTFALASVQHLIATFLQFNAPTSSMHPALSLKVYPHLTLSQSQSAKSESLLCVILIYSS